MLLASLLGGLFIGVCSALPIVSLGNCCCLWVTGGGFLAAYVLAQNEPDAMSVRRGAAVGFGAGVVGAVVWLLASLGLDAVLGPLERRVLGEIVGTARDMPPNVRAWLESASADAGSAFKYALMFGLLLFVGTPFAAFGGVLGAAFFRSDVPPALGGPIAPPPLP